MKRINEYSPEMVEFRIRAKRNEERSLMRRLLKAQSTPLFRQLLNNL